MDDHDERVRERAHEIWEAEGRPEGREYSHWLRARAEIHEEEGEAVRQAQSGLILRPDLDAPAAPRQKEASERASTADIARNTLPPGTVPENPTAENPDRIARLKPVRAKKPIDGRDIDAQLDQPS
ncbi:DUF2934 domain-containing protein [Shinella sp. G-2]|uniref:DUF2934 domain-containing protein n=1 Tax=Shinella sp. G-2 TaxID=3133141 RepID=UPI003D01F56A